MQIDVNTFIGAYPWRDIGPADPADLLRTIERVGTTEAWVSHLASMFWRDPTYANDTLYAMQRRFAPLRAVPIVHPGLPRWREDLERARAEDVPAVRCDPNFLGVSLDQLHQLAQECGETDVVLCMSVRLEDVRQRHPNDRVEDLAPWVVRELVRRHTGLRLLVTHADREFVEQVHFGLTLAEASRLLWDICWIWGPPEDHLALLLQTVGPDRFAFGTASPMRLPETASARLDLLNDATLAARIASENVQLFCGRGSA